MMVKGFTVAAAQIAPNDGDVPAAIETHVKFIEAASREHVDLVVFPELSVTGYGVKFDSEECFAVDDNRLTSIVEHCRRGNIAASVGVPLRMHGGVHLAALLIMPDGRVNVYCKRHLYGAEADFFVPGDRTGLFPVVGVNVALAICADSAAPSHAEQARKAGADLYAVGAVSSKNGYEKKSAALQGYAKLHGMNALFANFVGNTAGHRCVGGSALWNARGDVVARGTVEGECLVVGEMSDAMLTAGRFVSV